MHIPKLKPVKALRKGYKDKSERARERERECGLIQAHEREWPDTTRPRYKDPREFGLTPSKPHSHTYTTLPPTPTPRGGRVEAQERPKDRRESREMRAQSREEREQRKGAG